MKTAPSVTILGCRGSVPAVGAEHARYGQGTTCVLARLAGQLVVLDAGTGILNLEDCLAPEEREVPLLLTHGHADHLLGLGMCPLLFRQDCRLTIYGKTREGLTAEQQAGRLFSPPLWPVELTRLPAQIAFRELESTVQLGDVTVCSLEGDHPGGVSLLRLSGGGKAVVLMTDCTLTGERRPEFLNFARDCDLLLIDGQYAPEEWARYAKFGHSTWIQAAEFGRDCGAAEVRIIHHDPGRTDAQLDAAAPALKAVYPRCSFARAGEEILL